MILHIDMDAFFAAIEQRDNPGLQGRPVIVAGGTGRSVVAAASYEARRFGIHSAMPVFQAHRRCRDLIRVPVNMSRYRSDSAILMDILSGFSPLVEPVSIDEAYMDITGCGKLFGSPDQIALAIKRKIKERLFLSASVGIAPLKFLAKIASDMNKPDGLTWIREAEVPEFLASLPIVKVPGVGPKILKELESLQIRYLGDIRRYPSSILIRKLGKPGHHLMALADGIDPSRVDPHAERKSISSETTFETDLDDPGALQRALLDRSEAVGKMLRARRLFCETVFIKVKFSDFSLKTRSHKLDTPICSSSAIYRHALTLMEKINGALKIRLIGVGVTHLRSAGLPVQMTLQPGERRQDEKSWECVDRAVDSIQTRFGNAVIGKASLKNP